MTIPKSSQSSASLLQDKSVQHALRETLRNFPNYSERVLKIRTKEGTSLEHFRLNSVQTKLVHTAVQRQLKEKGKVRLIILKARQMGISTYVQGRFFHKAVTTPTVTGMTVTHVREQTQKIFQMNRLFYEQLPQLLRPERRFSNKTEIVFKDPLNSALYIDTAGESTARGGTIHLFHASEVAYWRHAEEAFLSVLQALSRAKGSEVFVESTAHGRSGYFYELYQKAKKGESDFEALFLPWYEMDEYQEDVPDDFIVTAREMRLAAKYHLTDRQLAWRRIAIRDLCHGDETIFDQEYPSNDEDAFIDTGKRFVSGTVTRKLRLGIQRPAAIGHMELHATEEHSAFPEFTPMREGWVSLWREPLMGRSYVIGADVGGTTKGTDYHAAYVVDHETGEMCAKIHGHLDIDVYAEQLDLLGRYFNTALIAVERNSGPQDYGTAMNSRLTEVLEYPNIYHEQTYNTEVNKYTKSLGWSTNARTRPLVIALLGKLARDAQPGDRLILDEELVSEYETLVYSDRGRVEAAEGQHDDLLMAFGITHALRSQTPPTSATSKVYKIPLTFP